MSHVARAQLEGLRLVVADHRHGRDVVVFEDLEQGRDLPLVHERRRILEIAQSRRAKCADEFRPGADEIKLRTNASRIVAVRSVATEFARLHFADANNTTFVRQLPRKRDHTGIVKFIVRQQRTVVALRAIRSTDKQLQADNFVIRI